MCAASCCNYGRTLSYVWHYLRVCVTQITHILFDIGGKLVTCVLRPAAIYGVGEQRHFPRIVKMIDLVCVTGRAYVCVCMCMRVCVCERERARESARKRERERERQREGERKSVCMCVRECNR